jgi:DNA-binding IclR family transcriptional regulator
MSPLYAGDPGERCLRSRRPRSSTSPRPGPRPDPDRTPTEAELRATLGGIVMTGMALSEGELIDGSVSMAAPVFREDGIVGAIAVIGPAFRCDEAWRTRVGRLLQGAARAINEELAEDRFQ